MQGGNPHGHKAKGKDKGQTQASGEETQTQTNAGPFEPRTVCAGGRDLTQPPGLEIRHRLLALLAGC